MKLLETLEYTPKELDFGTSGLRGLASDMTDLECYINACGFIDFLVGTNDIKSGSKIGLAGDLRDSTPRILRAVCRAILDSSCEPEYLGLIPTPALAHWGLGENTPVIMVTGSHIPADRNGIKFYKRNGEVLKEDESKVLEFVSKRRKQVYSLTGNDIIFLPSGDLKSPPSLPGENFEAALNFKSRYLNFFGKNCLSGKNIIFYQHSAVGRDMLVELLSSMGATVTAVGRSDVFIPIDTENITLENRSYFKSLASKYNDSFAIISTDGDSDRPFVIDEQGTFHRGDVVGAITAEFLKVTNAVIPISSSDAVEAHLNKLQVKLTYTKIGSPYVISAMDKESSGNKGVVAGWEVNGGFLTNTDIEMDGKLLKALPTRDAVLPIICSLLYAANNNLSLSEVFAQLSKRYTQAGLIDDFPVATSRALVEKLSEDSMENRKILEEYFNSDLGFGKIQKINSMDGIRIFLENDDIAHIRPSNNAPQLRIYSVANSQERADEIVSLALEEPDGILRKLSEII